ncbi:beta-glucosidase H [Saccharicrinis sp. 156]|uniref:beta-glucosidase n=1 Tax=Saccharicrinis sp. 156 TaxID=3417574 RepID=UPI003D352557
MLITKKRNVLNFIICSLFVLSSCNQPNRTPQSVKQQTESLHKRVAAIPAPQIPVYHNTKVYNEYFTEKMELFVDSIIKLMTIPEKLKMVQGDIERKAPPTRGSAAVDRLGIKPAIFYNGPRGFQMSGRSTLFPTGVAQAASFRPELIEQTGGAIAKELMARNFHVLEAPSMNIIRDPLCGRNFEYFTEDPCLNAQMTVAFVHGGQRAGAITSAKHFVGNNKEQNRGQLNAVIDERSLHEIYFPGFKAACEAGVLSIMTGANRVNGPHASGNPHIIDVLKREWNWPGFLYTDWNGVQSTLPAFNAGLDLSMPGKPKGPWAIEKLTKEWENGNIDLLALDDKVRRLLRSVYFAGRIKGSPKPNKQAVDYKAHHKLAYDVALASMVLVKNEDNVLPIKSELKQIAVIGPMATKKFSQESGGSSGVAGVMYDVSPLEGLEAKFGNKITHVPFDISKLYQPVGTPEVYHLNKDGEKVQGFRATYSGKSPDTNENVSFSVTDKKIDFNWEMASPYRNKLAPDGWKASWNGVLRPTQTGNHVFRIKGTQIVRLFINGKLASNKHRIQRQRETNIHLEAGKEYQIELQFSKKRGDGSIQLFWIKPDAEDKLNAILNNSVEVAKEADMVVVLAGLDHNTESEGLDRLSMGLPDYQNSLISKVLEVNKNTAVIVYGGTPMEMTSWFDQASALILPFYAGIENGNALASLLAGDADFGGRMPITFPKKYEDSPAFPARQIANKNDTIDHNEGIFVGYRWYDKYEIEPLIPFGHGLSYSTFNYSKPTVVKNGESVKVQIEIENTGNREGIEVVQVYVADMECSVPRPVRELKKFKSIQLKSGEKHTLSFVLNTADFSFWHPEKREWTLEAGEFEIQLGSSSRNIRETVAVNL